MSAMPPHAQTYALQFLDSWLHYKVATSSTPGLSVAIYAADRIIFSNAYGLADTNERIPLTPKHIFAAASQSKMLTGAALLQLVTQRKLRLDAPPFYLFALDKGLSRYTPLLCYTAPTAYTQCRTHARIPKQ